MRRMVIGHVAWMEHYAGDIGTLHPGTFNFDHANHQLSDSAEATNFVSVNGRCWGYIPFNAGGRWFPRMNLPRICKDTATGSETVDDVTVVWTARHPVTEMRVVVGWYGNATVHAEAKDFADTRGNGTKERPCYFEAPAENCVVVPINARTLEILTAQRAKRGGIRGRWPGMNAVFYVADANPELADKIFRYVSEKDHDILFQNVSATMAIHTLARSTAILMTEEMLAARLRQEVATAISRSQTERQERLASASDTPLKIAVISHAFLRNADVIGESLYRAGGRCGGCGRPAPFIGRARQEPYLEVHHRVPLAAGGKDTVENAIALCANCHRQEHHGPSRWPWRA